MSKEKTLLIDGNSIMNRAFYGLPLLTNSEGQYTNAVYGFLNILFKVMNDEEASHIAVAFDLKAPTFRHEKYTDYKGNRKGMPDELRPQMPLIKEVLKSMNISIYEVEGYEADDVIGTLAKRCESDNMDVTVLSGDRDLLQLATDKIKISIPKTKQGTTTVEHYYDKDVTELYEVTPIEFIDIKGLMGDPSDNIPGVPGIGEKTAIKIIKEYHSIENAYEHMDVLKPPRASKNLKEHYDMALLSKELATICIDCDINTEINAMKIENIYNEEAYKIIKRLEFKSLLEKFDVKTEDTNELVAKHELIKNKDAFVALIDKLKSQDLLAYYFLIENNEIIGLSIAYNKDKSYYIQCNDDLTEEVVINSFSFILESESIKKITHHLKHDYHLFKKYKIEPNSIIFDTFVGAYTISPTRDTYNFDDLANEFLGVLIKSEEELLGKGRNKKSFQDINEDEMVSYGASIATILFESYESINNKLKESDMYDLFYNIEMPLIKVLYNMEDAGIKVDSQMLQQYSQKLGKVINSIEKEIYEMSGEPFNINSPKQLGIILFEKLNLPVVKKTKTGYSTAAEVLEKLSDKHPIIDKITEYRQLTKLKSTYADGLFDYISKDDSRIHSTFNQTITATGRISSTEPNLQNIPIRMAIGREIRKVFIPKDDYIFIDADYSQIELRLLAHLSEDETLIRAYNENQDIHRLTASQVFHVPYDEVTSLQRSNAKAVNFGIVYGISAFSLSQDIGTSRKEAQEYINNYFKKYPNVKIFLDNCIRYANNRGYSETMFGRKRMIPELKSKNFIQRSFGERVAMNTPIQGSAADIIKIAMINVNNRLEKEHLQSKLILQVHDELLIEAHKDEIEKVKKLLVEEMENAVKLSVPLKADMSTGDSWFETK